MVADRDSSQLTIYCRRIVMANCPYCLNSLLHEALLRHSDRMKFNVLNLASMPVKQKVIGARLVKWFLHIVRG